MSAGWKCDDCGVKLAGPNASMEDLRRLVAAHSCPGSAHSKTASMTEGPAKDIGAFAAGRTEEKPLPNVKVTRIGGTILIPLPRALWTSCGRCDCKLCKGSDGFWDTLAVSADPIKGRYDGTWTVHAPELQKGIE